MSKSAWNRTYHSMFLHYIVWKLLYVLLNVSSNFRWHTLLPFFHSVVTGSEKGCQMLQILWLSLFVTYSNCYLHTYIHLTVSTDWLKRKPDKNEDKPYAETKVTKIWQILCESPFHVLCPIILWMISFTCSTRPYHVWNFLYICMDL